MSKFLSNVLFKGNLSVQSNNISTAQNRTLLDIVSNRTYTEFLSTAPIVDFRLTITDNNAGNNSFYDLIRMNPTINHSVGLAGQSSLLNISPVITKTGGATVDVGPMQFLKIAPAFSGGHRHISLAYTTRAIFIDPTFTGVTGSNNFVAFENTRGVVFLSSSSGSVGVGFSGTAPLAKLHVRGDSATTGSALIVQNSTPANLFEIRNNGNVGINQSTDAGFKLDVNGTVRVQGIFSGIEIRTGAHAFRDQMYISHTADGWTKQNTYNVAGAHALTFVGDLRFASSAAIKAVFAFNGAYSNNGTVYGGEMSLMKLFTSDAFGQNAVPSAGMNQYGINLMPTLNYTLSTSTFTGFYYNPTVTSTTGLTHYAMNLVTGLVKIGNLSGSGTQMVVSDSNGVLGVQAIPTGSLQGAVDADKNTSSSLAVGTTIVKSVSATTYSGVFFDYVVKNGTNVRVGSVVAISNGTNVEFYETLSNDIGTTTALTFTVTLGSGNINLNAVAAATGWTVIVSTRAI